MIGLALLGGYCDCLVEGFVSVYTIPNATLQELSPKSCQSLLIFLFSKKKVKDYTEDNRHFQLYHFSD